MQGNEGKRYVIRCAVCREHATVTLSAYGDDAVRAERAALAAALTARGFRAVELVGPFAAPFCCSRRLSMRRVEGTITGDACDDLCRKATGATCRCACGGSNHGAQHELRT
jgi:hypothetical protein